MSVNLEGTEHDMRLSNPHSRLCSVHTAYFVNVVDLSLAIGAGGGGFLRIRGGTKNLVGQVRFAAISIGTNLNFSLIRMTNSSRPVLERLGAIWKSSFCDEGRFGASVQP